MVETVITSSLALLMMGLCLQASLRLLYGARGPAPDDEVHLFMRILSWTLILVPAGVLFVAGANWLSILLFVAMLEALFELILGRRSLQRHAAWRLLAASLSGGRSAVESLRFHQARFTGLVGRWYRRLAADLERGVAWPQAMWQNRRALPREAPAVAAMVDLGAAPASEVYHLDDSRDYAFQVARQQLVQRLSYLAMVSLIMAAIMTFVMIRIIPSYQQIYADFDLDLPRITRALIGLANGIESAFGVALVMLIIAAVAAAVGIGICYLADFDVLRPITDRALVSRHQAWVLRLLAAAFVRGKPVGDALTQLTGGWSSYPSRFVRERLAETRRLIDAGHRWQDALVRTRLISTSDAGVLAAAQEAGNLPWAMRMLADRKMRLSAFRWSVAQQVIFTLIVLAFGLFVLWVGAGMIIPLADLVLSLSK